MRRLRDEWVGISREVHRVLTRSPKYRRAALLDLALIDKDTVDCAAAASGARLKPGTPLNLAPK